MSREKFALRQICDLNLWFFGDFDFAKSSSCYPTRQVLFGRARLKIPDLNPAAKDYLRDITVIFDFPLPLPPSLASFISPSSLFFPSSFLHRLIMSRDPWFLCFRYFQSLLFFSTLFLRSYMRLPVSIYDSQSLMTPVVKESFPSGVKIVCRNNGEISFRGKVDRGKEIKRTRVEQKIKVSLQQRMYTYTLPIAASNDGESLQTRECIWFSHDLHNLCLYTPRVFTHSPFHFHINLLQF